MFSAPVARDRNDVFYAELAELNVWENSHSRRCSFWGLGQDSRYDVPLASWRRSHYLVFIALIL